MKILLTADPEIPVPPKHYGGIERILDVLVKGYVGLGHDVTLIAHPESVVPCKLISWKRGKSGGFGNTVINSGQLVSEIIKENYDVLHSFSRLGYLAPLLPLSIPKIMSYQREPTVSQIKRAARLSKKGSLLFTGCSNYIRDRITPFAKAVTVYNCVPIEKYSFTETVATDAPLMFLGRIEPVKGTHLAVEVARQSGKQLIIAGNIPAEGEVYFEQKIKPFLNERIQYIGPVNDTQKAFWLGKSLAFLMPVQWNEPFGIVMAEAMACGTPVLGFPYGSVPEVVEHGVTGFTFNNVEEMSAGIKLVQGLDRKKVRETAERRFSDKTIVSEYLALYEQHKWAFVRQ